MEARVWERKVDGGVRARESWRRQRNGGVRHVVRERRLEIGGQGSAEETSRICGVRSSGGWGHMGHI